jgi:Tellurite resistance protein TerB
MQEGDTSSDRRRVQEDEYFRRRDQELLEQQRRRAEAEAERRLIAQAIGLNDDAVVVDLQLVGYRSDTIVLLELAPSIQVAWADGSVSTRERELLLKIAAREHVAQGSPARDQLEVWIRQRPSTDLFEASLRALNDILNSLQPNVRASLRRKVIDDCTAIAGASGGFLGWNHMSSDERHVIERIAKELA